MCGRTGGRDISQKEEKVSQLTELFWFSITATAEQHNAALEAISGRTSSSSSSSHRIDYPFLQNGANRSICACILIQAGWLASTGGTRMEFDMMNDGASTSRTPQSNKYVWSPTTVERKSHLSLHKCAVCMYSQSGSLHSFSPLESWSFNLQI